MIVSEDRLSKAITYLAETDATAARARGYMLGLERQSKTIEGILYLQTMGGTIDEKKARVHSHQEYRDHTEKYENAVADFETLRNKRETESLIVEIWRSEGANRRKGNI